MATWDRDNAPTWQPGAEADQLGWADEATGEVLVSTKPNTVNTNFLNQAERAKALAWVNAGLLVPSEAGMTGAIVDVALVAGGSDYTTPPTIAVVGDGTLGAVVANMSAVGTVKSAAINAAGTGYKVADVLQFDFNGGVGASLVVDTVGGAGEILTFTVVNQGSGYTADGPAVPLTSTLADFVGSGATVAAIVGFPIASFSVTVPGTEYAPNDTEITVTGDGIGGAGQAIIAKVGSGDFGVMEALAISRLP